MYESIARRVATLVFAVESIATAPDLPISSPTISHLPPSKAYKTWLRHSLTKLSPNRVQLAAISSITAALVSIPRRVAAQSSASCGDMPSQFQEIAELLTRIQRLGIALALLIATVMLIYGGILWMRGTPDSQQKARRIIFNTFVGLVIVLMAAGSWSS